MAYIQPDKENYNAGEMQYGNFMVPGSNTNQNGLLHSFNMIGSITEMPTIADRDAIPINTYSSTNTGFTDNLDGISSGRRRIGMLVYVLETLKHYQLLPKGYFGNAGNSNLEAFNALPEWDRARLLSPEASGIYTDQSSFQPGQGLVYTEVPITGVAADCWVEVDLSGEVGPVGPAGPDGPIGPIGIKGDPGDKGDQGIQGEAGVKGDAGSQGIQGVPGIKGDAGDSTVILGTLSSTDDLCNVANPSIGDSYIISGQLWTYDGVGETAQGPSGNTYEF